MLFIHSYFNNTVFLMLLQVAMEGNKEPCLLSSDINAHIKITPQQHPRDMRKPVQNACCVLTHQQLLRKNNNKKKVIMPLIV